jgi:hypothetical protein
MGTDKTALECRARAKGAGKLMPLPFQGARSPDLNPRAGPKRRRGSVNRGLVEVTSGGWRLLFRKFIASAHRLHDSSGSLAAIKKYQKFHEIYACTYMAKEVVPGEIPNAPLLNQHTVVARRAAQAISCGNFL